jgi:hypothetical protein
MSATAKLMAMLGMDASQFTKGVDQAERRTKGFGSMLSGMKGKIAAAFTVGAIVGVVKNVAGAAGDIADMAENLGITTDEFQAMTLAAKQFGIEGGDIATILNRIALAQAEFVSGSPSQDLVDRMDALGISLDQADAMNAAQFFEAVSVGANKTSEGLDAALKTMGRTGPRFQAFMKLMAGAGLGGMIAGASASGELVSESDIKATDAVIDGLIQKWKNKTVKAASFVIGAVATKATTGAATTFMEDSGARAARNQQARQRADEKAAEKLTAEAAEIRAKNVYDALTDEQKILALKEEQADLDAKMAEAKTQTARAELDKQRAESEGKLASLEAGNVKPGAGMAYDQLRRIGAGVFSGTASDAIPKNQLAELRKISLSMNRLETKKSTGGVF